MNGPASTTLEEFARTETPIPVHPETPSSDRSTTKDDSLEDRSVHARLMRPPETTDAEKPDGTSSGETALAVAPGAESPAALYAITR